MKPHMPVRSLLLLAFLVYVLLDLGCPLVPGAFTFDPAESVDAVSAYRARPPALPRVPPAPPAMTSILVRPDAPGHFAVEASAVPSPAGWRPHAGRDHALASDPCPSLDDD